MTPGPKPEIPTLWVSFLGVLTEREQLCALVKMRLIGMAAFLQGLTEELVIKLIQPFAKTVEHDRQYLKIVLVLLNSNGYTTMAHMAILITN